MANKMQLFRRRVFGNSQGTIDGCMKDLLICSQMDAFMFYHLLGFMSCQCETAVGTFYILVFFGGTGNYGNRSRTYSPHPDWSAVRKALTSPSTVLKREN